jgi:endonuclease
MPIYERPTKSLMADWAKDNLKPGQIFKKSDPVGWFAEHYPKIKRPTVEMHVEGMSTNDLFRRHHPNIKPGKGFDLFYKLGPGQFRLWDPNTDPAPIYKDDIEKGLTGNITPQNGDDDEGDAGVEDSAEATAFAYEKDLRSYLVKNLSVIEPGLHLYEEEEITGEEFAVGGRFIDILAIDKEGAYVVIELKVSRGYDRTIGQLLRYMAWVKKNMETQKPVRGFIVAKEITDDLKLAASLVSDVRLVEYKISFELRPV